MKSHANYKSTLKNSTQGTKGTGILKAQSKKVPQRKPYSKMSGEEMLNTLVSKVNKK